MAVETKIRIPLSHEFRYFHEPVSGGLFGKWAVGRNQLAGELADRIVLSRGGAFLVGGLRGVGKTTFVRLAMHAIRSSAPRYADNVGPFELVDVWLNISRTVEPVQLLHLLIRHLYLRLKEMKLLARLDAELQKDLSTAFMRTAFEISSRKLNEEERGRGMEVGFGKAPWIGIEFLGKLSSSYKRSRTDEEGLKYLPYDEKAAEFDIVNFARRLQEGTPRLESFWQRMLRPFRGAPPAAPSIRVVFVLDELDKLERPANPVDPGKPDGPADCNGISVLDPILGALKTVFSASGFSFVFVGGKEVEERMIEDISHADSIYESIFAYNLYLPCLWEDQGEILAQCMAPEGAALGRDAASYRGTVERYLRYKGRGIPRRTWREVNKYVWWEEDGPKLILDVKSRRYVELFSKLEESLQDDDLFNALGRTADNVRRDRQRLYFYYTADWVLGRGRDEFSALEVVETAKALNLGGQLTAASAATIAQTTLDILRNRAFIEIDTERTQSILAGAAPQSVYYRLCPWVLRAFEGSAEEEAKAAVRSAAPEPRPQREELRRLGAYQVLEEIGSGASSQIFKVRSDASGELRAAKVLRPEVAQRAMLRARFEDEIAAMRRISAPGLMRIYGSGEHDGRPYLIMDLLDGLTLSTLIGNVKTLSIGIACRIAAELAETLGAIHATGLTHRDVKPGNVFLTHDGKTKVLDLGIARNSPPGGSSAATASISIETILGTPGYMAPEQLLSPSRVDLRADIYALGATLFEMISGQLPFGRPDQVFDWLGLREEAPSLLAFSTVPKELAAVVARALRRAQEERFDSMEEFRRELLPWRDARPEELIGLIASCQSSASIGDQATMVGFDPDEPTLQPVTMHGAMKGGAPGGGAAGGGAMRGGAGMSEWEDDSFPVSAPPPPAAMPALWSALAKNAASRRKHANDFEWLWNGSRAQQEEAFQRLCATGETQHLLFDFAREICLWGGDKAIGRSLLLRHGRLILGRGTSEVDLPLDAPKVSRQHLAFFVSTGTIVAEDLSSAVGTRLNGERLAREALKDGDMLRIGSVEIRVHCLPRDRTLIAEVS